MPQNLTDNIGQIKKQNVRLVFGRFPAGINGIRNCPEVKFLSIQTNARIILLNKP
jgi:hypothetical protein